MNKLSNAKMRDTYWFTSGNFKRKVNIFSKTASTKASIMYGSSSRNFDLFLSIHGFISSEDEDIAVFRFFSRAAAKPAAQT